MTSVVDDWLGLSWELRDSTKDHKTDYWGFRTSHHGEYTWEALGNTVLIAPGMNSESGWICAEPAKKKKKGYVFKRVQPVKNEKYRRLDLSWEEASVLNPQFGKIARYLPPFSAEGTNFCWYDGKLYIPIPKKFWLPTITRWGSIYST